MFIFMTSLPFFNPLLSSPQPVFRHGFDGDGNSSATSDSNTYYEDDFSSSDDSSGEKNNSFLYDKRCQPTRMSRQIFTKQLNSSVMSSILRELLFLLFFLVDDAKQRRVVGIEQYIIAL